MRSAEPPPVSAGKTIVLVLSSLGAGGAEGVIAQLANHWVQGGAAVTVIAFDAPDAPIYHRFDPTVRFVRLGLPPSPGRAAALGRTARRLLRLRTAIREIAPDAVVSFLLKINVTVLLACAGLGVPVIVSERNHPTRGAGSRAWLWARARLYPGAAAVVLQTEASRRALPPAIASRGVVIPNPVEPHGTRRTTGCTRTLVAVGRLEPQKGFDLLIEAFARIAGRHPGWQLVIWGEGSLRHALEAQRARLGLADRISLPGVTTRPGEWRESASVFVLSSRYEGFSNVVAEALAAGIPVVACDCEFGVAEILGDGAYGVLVAPEDVGALAAGVDRLLATPALRHKLATIGSEQSGRFAPAAVLARWDAVVTA